MMNIVHPSFYAITFRRKYNVKRWQMNRFSDHDFSGEKFDCPPIKITYTLVSWIANNKLYTVKFHTTILFVYFVVHIVQLKMVYTFICFNFSRSVDFFIWSKKRLDILTEACNQVIGWTIDVTKTTNLYTLIFVYLSIFSKLFSMRMLFL